MSTSPQVLLPLLTLLVPIPQPDSTVPVSSTEDKKKKRDKDFSVKTQPQVFSSARLYAFELRSCMLSCEKQQRRQQQQPTINSVIIILTKPLALTGPRPDDISINPS